MTWEAISAISQALSAIAVVLTVVYLAAQIRKSRIATESLTYYLATAAGAQTAATIAASAETSCIYQTGLSSPSQLEEKESFRFALLLISQFRRYENLFFQHRSGLIDEEYWIAQRENMLWFFHRSGVQTWWKEKRLAFSQSFRTFLEGSNPTELKSPANRRV
jgi:hypothetical protein